MFGAPIAGLPDPSVLWHGAQVSKSSRPRAVTSAEAERQPDRDSPPATSSNVQNVIRRETGSLMERKLNGMALVEERILAARRNEDKVELTLKHEFSFGELPSQPPSERAIYSELGGFAIERNPVLRTSSEGEPWPNCGQRLPRASGIDLCVGKELGPGEPRSRLRDNAVQLLPLEFSGSAFAIRRPFRGGLFVHDGAAFRWLEG